MKGVHAILSVVLLCAAATVSNAATPPGFEPESTISLFPGRPTRVWQNRLERIGDETNAASRSPRERDGLDNESDLASAARHGIRHHAYQVRAKIHKYRELCDAAAVRDRDRARAIALGRSGWRQEDMRTRWLLAQASAACLRSIA